MEKPENSNKELAEPGAYYTRTNPRRNGLPGSHPMKARLLWVPDHTQG